jgi:serine/threonine-protein phosphatase 2A regulatory subunit A
VAKSYGVLIDIFKRLPAEPSNLTLVQFEKQQGSSSGPGSEQGARLITEEVLPPLEKLMQDDDVDVRFFATTAAKSWTDANGGDAMET